MAYETTLVDEVRYAEPSDVSVYKRNKTFDAESDPTATEVETLLFQASERIDRKTGRAWRTRKAVDLELPVEFSRDQRGIHYRTRHRGAHYHHRSGVYRNARRRRALVMLPHIELQEWDTAQDSVTILRRDTTEDITADEGRGEDGKYVVDEKGGMLHIDHREFTTGPLHGGELDQPARVRVSYRYGNDESGNTVSQSAPADITEACAKMVAADLMRTDQYGSIITSGPENVPNQTTAASAMWSGAMSIIESRARRSIL